MSATGYIQLRAYESYAELPLKDVAVVITADDGTAIAMRLTDRSGMINPIAIPVPDKSESLEPGSEKPPYTSINLYAYLPGYEQIIAEDLQVFADTTTYQDLEMVPLSEMPDDLDQTIEYDTPPQNL